ncbi:hypothetical protein [Sulfoacidibacillus thermotolerans]|uniref:Uncharacterized protein n=1 Tax=Sulfoacidibacillus thermotolerans TaxID=1765684 RepID=A0A2U3D084_SULT2|nr:hypothetical protein [Sulfoacidibacillus thermotolerans]PWI54692.1 hypothetical protein BM613_13695 [Sulfoacidibacillus thermotolerans]
MFVDSSDFLHPYYLSLFELLGAIVFLIVFKVIMVYAMEKMSKTLAEKSQISSVHSKEWHELRS